MNHFIAFSIGLFLATGVGAAGGGGRGGFRFEEQPVKRGALAAVVKTTGTVEPEEVIDVGAQVVGRIEKFGADPRGNGKPIDYGSPVKAGGILAQIDPAPFKVKVARAKAQLQQAEAALELAKAKVTLAESEFQRTKKRAAAKAGDAADVEVAQAALGVARAEAGLAEAAVGEKKAAVAEAQLNLDSTTIRSPVEGIIIDRRVNVGQTVSAALNAPSLFLIATSLKKMQVWASVPEYDIARIAKGQAVSFTVDARPDETFKGRVLQIRLNATKEGQERQVMYTVVVATDNSDEKLLPFLTANVRIAVGKRKNALLVPSAALRWRPCPEHVRAEDRFTLLGTTLNKQPTVWVAEKGFVHPVTLKTGSS